MGTEPNWAGGAGRFGGMAGAVVGAGAGAAVLGGTALGGGRLLVLGFFGISDGLAGRERCIQTEDESRWCDKRVPVRCRLYTTLLVASEGAMQNGAKGRL